MIWGMFMTVTMESAVFMGKNYLNKCQSIVNTTDLTLKQMFDISTRLVSEQDEISGLHRSWKYLSKIGDERIINLQRTKVYVFSDSVLCLGKIFETPNRMMHGNKIGMVKIYTRKSTSFRILCCALGRFSKILNLTMHGNKRLGWIKSSQNYRKFDRIDGERMEFEWNIFPGFNTLQLSEEVKSLLYRLRETPEHSHRQNSIYVDVQRHFLWNKRQ